MAKKKPVDNQEEAAGNFGAKPVVADMRVDKSEALERMALSGLDEDDYDRLQLSIIPAQELNEFLYGKPGPQPLSGLCFKYVDPATGKDLQTRTRTGPFRRIRKLVPVSMSNDEAIKKYGPDYMKRKYMSPLGSGVEAYFPGNLCVPGEEDMTWADIIDNIDQPVLITEGEFKAAKSCKEGYPCIGLGGVTSYAAAAWGMELVESLLCVVWAGRRVTITFDSDCKANTNVQRAMLAFAEVLHNQGANVWLNIVPTDENGGKQGIDDWYVNNPGADWMTVHRAAVSYTEFKKLLTMNETYGHVRDTGLFYDKKMRQLATGAAVRDANGKAMHVTFTKDGNLTHERLSLFDLWKDWELRRNYDKIGFEPSMAPAIDYVDDEGFACYNTWTGLKTVPLKGDVKPVLQLLEHQFKGQEPGSLKWFKQWLAYPLQHLGTKLTTYVVFYGPETGTGKTSMGLLMGRVYGPNAYYNGDIFRPDGFNNQIARKLFVQQDELHSGKGETKQALADRLKAETTQEMETVNEKGKPSYQIRNCRNLFITSNSLRPVHIDENDRRGFLVRINPEPFGGSQAAAEKFFIGFYEWLKGGGPAAWLHYLLHEVDLAGFNPYGRAPMTEAKREVQAATRSAYDTWAQLVRDNPAEMLATGRVEYKYDMAGAKHLRVCCETWLKDNDPKTPFRARDMDTALSVAGLPQLRKSDKADHRVITKIDGKSASDLYTIVANVKEWTSKTETQQYTYAADLAKRGKTSD